MGQFEHDLEAAKANTQHGVSVVETTGDNSSSIIHVVDGTEKADCKRANSPALQFLGRAETWLNKKFGIETGGIDRVLEHEKQPPSILNMFLIYWSSICHIGNVPIGLVGPLFGFSLRQSACGIVVGAMIGALCPAFCATLGPLTGLRALAVSRYSFGFWGAKLCAILNVFVCGSYLVINFITVSQILSAVSEFSLSLSVGSIIIGVLSYILSVFGFHFIHAFERYSWIVAFVLFCVLLGQAGPHIGVANPNAVAVEPSTGTWLSFFAITISATSGWCSVVGDYTCHYPATIKRWKVFGLTWTGVFIPTAFVCLVGACIGDAAVSAQYPPYAEAFTNHGLGGLVLAIYQPLAWSKFCLVILTFTVLGNNVVAIYSSGLSLQLLGHHFHAVPRFIWSLVFSLVTVILAVVGQDHLVSVVSNAVALMGYWGIAFTTIILVEDQWFRRGDQGARYDLDVWDQPRKLPVGAAGVAALLAGYLAGGVTGMAQTWFVGPLAAKIGDMGGDVGLYLTGLIALVVYFPARHVERKLFGR